MVNILTAMIAGILGSVISIMWYRRSRRIDVEEGCIILGYQGIGKSTLSHNNLRYIDLESSNFRNLDGTRSENWYIYYCQTAMSLALDGYIVFIATHKEVQQVIEAYYKTGHIKAYVCFPSKRLVQAWISKLERRYKDTGLDKDYRAYKNAQDCYTENIERFEKSPLPSMIIHSMNYDLGKFIADTLSRNKAK